MDTLVINILNLELTLGGQDILTIPKLSVYENERIGIIGKNGVGKTSLLKLISGELNAEKGNIQREIDFTYYKQFEESKQITDTLDGELLSRFHIPKSNENEWSGGEASKYRLTQALSNYQSGLILDEPTTHLDEKSIDLLTEELKYYYGTLIFVSHDRYFLDKLATKIWEVADGMVTEYVGNYTDYLALKKADIVRKKHESENYQREKQKLEQSLIKKKRQATRMSKVSAERKKRNIRPDRLSSSKQKDTIQKNVQKTAKVIEGKLSRLKEVHSPIEAKTIHFSLPKSLELHNQFPIMGVDLDLKAGQNSLLKNANFQFKNEEKIAIVGDNGIGKTTLLNHIFSQGEGIVLSPKVQFSKYSQHDYNLDDTSNLLKFIEKKSDFSEKIIRSVLHNLGFKPEQITESVNNLSGGEATKVALALVFLRPANVLILDEPTSFIDLPTITALQKLIKDYPGLVIFTSHDRYFVESTATKIYEIENQKLKLKNNRD